MYVCIYESISECMRVCNLPTYGECIVSLRRSHRNIPTIAQQTHQQLPMP